MADNKITFWKFLQENEIEIPIIQRDYAQGRLGKEYLRQGFLSSIKKALDSEIKLKLNIGYLKKTLDNEIKLKLDFGSLKKALDSNELKLDFIYGSLENGKLQPLDGQQRLTTLWLLHWYIALMAGKLNEAGETLKRFTYETRISSREFCEHLCDSNNFKNFKGTNVVEFITNQTWFYSAWKQDPTIQSMLRMLGGTKINNKKGDDIIDGIEELFGGLSAEEMGKYWDKLTNDKPIVFYYLPLKDFGLSDDLYIKMNARGKQLTMFENFKADLIGFIQQKAMEENKQKAKAENKSNNGWKNLLDGPNAIPVKMDIDWTDIFWVNKSKENKIDEIYFAFINRYILNHFCLEFNEKDEIEDTKTFKALYGKKGNNSELKYTTFDVYKISSLENGGLLNKLQVTLNNFYSSISILDGEGKPTLDLEKIQEKSLPSWDKEDDFLFIPKYEDNEHTITTLSQKQRVVFHAICKYFEKVEYEKETFKQWMRVVWNLVTNGNINSIKSMIGCLKLIDELSANSHDIYTFLASDKAIQSKYAEDQLSEEREKAKKIIEDPNWESKIIEAEKYAFFTGAIRFLFRDGTGNWNWEKFDQKWENVKKYFNPDNGYYKKDSLLLRFFISKFTKWHLFWNMTFDNQDSSWRDVLLDEKWIKPIHEILVAGNIEIDHHYKSPFSNNFQQAQVQEDLVKSSLLEDKNLVVGCRLNYYNADGNYILYPYNAKSDWKKYIIANKRNDILSALYGGEISSQNKDNGKIYTDQKLKKCDFFWGKEICFDYILESVSYKFRWQSWNWIDMYDGEIRLYKGEDDATEDFTIEGEKINTPEDFIQELKRCIVKYKEYKKETDKGDGSNEDAKS